ncbi:MAG: hypothetical protein AABZ61_09545 [Bacteroidota bacterium]
MGESSVTLSRVFSLQGDKTPAGEAKNIPAGKLDLLRERIIKEVEGIKWSAALPELTEKIGELFNIEVPDILLAAWKKIDALKKYLDSSQYAPEETIYAELAEHTITGELHPYLEIQVKNIPVKKIEFTVNLSLAVKGIVLKIQNGRIKEIKTGTCEVKGRIEYQDLVIAEKALEPMQLPGSINLGEGVTIAA